jgi:hypothetical protein
MPLTRILKNQIFQFLLFIIYAYFNNLHPDNTIEQHHLNFVVPQDSQSINSDIEQHAINLGNQGFHFEKRLTLLLQLLVQEQDVNEVDARKITAAILKAWRDG